MLTGRVSLFEMSEYVEKGGASERKREIQGRRHSTGNAASFVGSPQEGAYGKSQYQGPILIKPGCW